MINRKKNRVILVNFWGLGDLIATLYLIKRNQLNAYHIITPHEQKLVLELIESLDLSGDITVSKNKSKVRLVFEVIYFIVKRSYIIFTAPLADRSRKLAIFLSLLSKNIILSKKNGNMYQINNEINIQQ